MDEIFNGYFMTLKIHLQNLIWFRKIVVPTIGWLRLECWIDHRNTIEIYIWEYLCMGEGMFEMYIQAISLEYKKKRVLIFKNKCNKHRPIRSIYWLRVSRSLYDRNTAPVLIPQEEITKKSWKEHKGRFFLDGYYELKCFYSQQLVVSSVLCHLFKHIHRYRNSYR